MKNPDTDTPELENAAEAITERSKVGRPSKYDPSMCEWALTLGRRGESWTGIADELGISRETLYDWQLKFPEFSDALKRARAAAQRWWEQTLQGQARGKYDGGSAAAAIWAMKNQFPDDYKDRREFGIDGKVGVFEIDFQGYNDEKHDDDNTDTT